MNAGNKGPPYLRHDIRFRTCKLALSRLAPAYHVFESGFSQFETAVGVAHHKFF
jgi:hypothetical protein